MVDERDPDETLESLVAGVFGDGEPKPTPTDTILVPPAYAVEPPPAAERPATPDEPVPRQSLAASPRPAAAEEPPPPAAVPEEPRRRRSLLQRLQVSPAVIVASIVAGATGAAADAWFEDLAAFFAQLTSDHEDVSGPSTMDLMPVGVAPSRFPEAAETGTARADPGTTPEPTPAVGEPAPGAGLPDRAEIAPAVAEQARPTDAVTGPADRVRVITWDEGTAGTVVTFWGNGTFPPERVERFRIPGAQPRELVKLRGIDVPFPQAVLGLGTPEVVRIRTGFHPQDRVNELHLVLDLTGPEVVIDRVETGPETLRIHLRRGSSAASAPAE